MTDARVSRVSVEALLGNRPNLRVSQETLEALHSNKPELDVSAAVVEVLYDSAPVVTGTLDGPLPRPVAAMSGTVISPVSGSLIGLLPAPSGNLSGTAFLPSADGSLAGVLDRPIAEITATYVDPAAPVDAILDGLLQLPVLDLAGVFTPEDFGSLRAMLPQPVGSLYVLVTTPWAAKPKRWVLRDPVRDETWTFPINPNKMTSPHAPRSFNILATAPSVTSNGQSRGGFGRVMEGNPEPYEWSFSGYIREQDHFQSLLYWTRKVNRLELTDHLGRTWSVRFLVFNPDEQRPTARHPWRFNYEIKTLNYGAIA